MLSWFDIVIDIWGGGRASTKRCKRGLQPNARVLLETLYSVCSLPFSLFHPLFTRSYWAFKLRLDNLTKLNRILDSLLDCGGGITTDCFCRRPNPLVCAWK